MHNGPPFDWDDIKALLAVARTGSTLAAARALDVNQTTIVRRIEGLETALALRLVDRGATGSTLTEAGRNLLAEGERMEIAATAVARRAGAEGRNVTGTLRITSTEALGSLIIEPALADFHRQHPDIRVDLDLAHRIVDLEAGEADVAVRGGLSLPHSDLIARKLSDLRIAIYCSRDYAARRGAPSCPEALAGHDVVVAEDNSPMPGVVWLLRQTRGSTPKFRFNTYASLVQALRAGLGVGPLISLVGDQDEELVCCFEAPDLKPAAWILTPSRLRDAPRARAFIDFIVPHFTARRRALEKTSRSKPVRTP